jgi:hypothetical protein
VRRALRWDRIAANDCAPVTVPMNVTVEKLRMKKNLLVLAALAVMLAGCVVVPERPLYVHAPRVVVY